MQMVLGHVIHFSLLQLFIVQMKRVNIIHLDRALPEKGAVLAYVPAVARK